MCGRFSRISRAEILTELFGLNKFIELSPSYNIAPGQAIAAVCQNTRSREMGPLRWGLVPSWAKDPKIGHKLINARTETVWQKPSFRSAIKKRRCLIPADGFYEWQRQKEAKQAYYVQDIEQKPWAFAGIWELWRDPQGQAIASCSILTTPANRLMQEVHHRMPLIIHPQDYDVWLRPESTFSDLSPLMIPYPSEQMQLHPVSSYINKPSNNDPTCTQAINITPQPLTAQVSLFN